MPFATRGCSVVHGRSTERHVGLWPISEVEAAGRGVGLPKVLRARRLPSIATVFASTRRTHSGRVPWRPVLKQVLPWRSLNSAAEIDPLLPSAVQLFCAAKSLFDHLVGTQ